MNLPTIQRKLSARPTVWLPAAAVTAFFALYIPLAGALLSAAAPAPSASASLPIVSAQPTAGTTNAQPQAANTVAAAPAAKTVVASYPNCTPLSFGMPSSLALASAPVGLSVQNDTPPAYRIYGDTAAELRSQIARCAPGANGSASAEFTAETSYNLTWQYDIVMSGDSVCSLSDVKVGLHIATALPQWLPTADAVSGLPGRWQSFLNALTTHESGHAALDRQYAAQLLGDLNALPSVSCDQLSASVQTLVNSDVGALNRANDTYDAQTNHGATQGAVLPTY